MVNILKKNYQRKKRLHFRHFFGKKNIFFNRSRVDPPLLRGFAIAGNHPKPYFLHMYGLQQ
jgi:hypothetical protein